MRTNNLRYLLGILTIYATVAWCLYVGAPLILGTLLFSYMSKVKKSRALASGLLKYIMDSSHFCL